MMGRRLAHRWHRLSSRHSVRSDVVDCTVFGPSGVSPNQAFLIQVFSHRPEQAATAKRLAKEFDRSAERRGYKSLEAEIQQGARLRFRLAMPGFDIDQDVQETTWRGRPESVVFGVRAPRNFPPGDVVCTVAADQDSVPVGHIKFKISVMPAGRPVQSEQTAMGEAAHRYKKAFISYATEDRSEVLKRVQMLSRLHIGFFQDVLSLEPGERWQNVLYRHIDESDLFLLFWSTAAKRSDWVMKEVRYAIRRKGQDEFAPPEILPIPIEGPPPVEPPPELAHLHFDDRLLYFMARPRGSS